MVEDPLGWPGQTKNWFLTRAMLRLADAALVVTLGIFVLPSSPMFGQTVPTVVGVPTGMVVPVIGFTGIVTGWAWIRMIARGDPEPESNDRFWISRM